MEQTSQFELKGRNLNGKDAIESMSDGWFLADLVTQKTSQNTQVQLVYIVSNGAYVDVANPRSPHCQGKIWGNSRKP